MKRTVKHVAGMGLLALVFLTGCQNTPSSTSSQTTPSNSVTSSISDFDATQKIIPYTRDTNSGTREGFMEKIGFDSAKKSDADLKNTVQQVASNGDMITSLANQEYGIGYFSADSITEANTKGLKVVSYEGTAPTETTILNGTYKLARNFNYCIAQETDATKTLLVNGFVAYMGTQEGLATVKNNGGIVSITASTPSWANIKTNYPGIESDHSTVTLNFGGSTSVEKIARALSAEFSVKAGNFKYNHNHTGSGDAYKNTQGSGKGTLDIAFASREFDSTNEPLAAGTFGKICIDGIVVGVSNKNPLANILAPQALAIYSSAGTMNKWSDILTAVRR
jgi:phosphate transport system substrate-binding protein